MSDTDTRYADLEGRLRAAGGTVPARPVPDDAWIELQSRLATRDGHHGRRVLAAAAVVALLLGLVGAAALLDDGSPAGGPASGPEGDPWAPEHYLGEPVVAETLTLGGQRVRHELVLTDTDGKGPSLCDRFVSGSGSAGGCSSRDARADDPAVAFDWLSGTTGGGDIHGVDGAVDDRVMKVQVWMDNGDETLVALHPTGWAGTRSFALTVPDTGPTPQRLVAYSDAKGTVLQAVDLPARYGKTWLTRHSACAGDRVAELVPDGDTLPNAYVALGTDDAQMSIRLAPDDSVDPCVERFRGTALAGWYPSGTLVAAVVAPEVVTVRLVRTDASGGQTVLAEVTPVTAAGSLWRVAVLRVANQPQLDNAQLLALDSHGVLDQAFVNQPSSP